jgi:nucleoside triphosphate pyrophosphatase
VVVAPTLVLGSASPRRARLLRQLGATFVVQASDVPEEPAPGETAEDFALRVAGEKAQVVAQARPRCWVLAADTVVIVDGAILGKPRDPAEARSMLLRLSDRGHEVLTAVVLAAPGGKGVDALVERSAVEFRALTAAEIETYVASGEPLDKAGAYAIQGGAAAFVTAVRGSHSNIVGLPLERVRALLQRRGLLAAAALERGR